MKKRTYKRLENKARVWRDIIANHVFVDYSFERSLKETCDRIVMHQGVLVKLRDKLRIDLKQSNKQYSANVRKNLYAIEPDLRTGDETYGYKSIESITGNLNYVSDRFMAEFRLTWLLEVPERVAQLER